MSALMLDERQRSIINAPHAQIRRQPAVATTKAFVLHLRYSESDAHQEIVFDSSNIYLYMWQQHGCRYEGVRNLHSLRKGVTVVTSDLRDDFLSEQTQ